MSLKEGVTNIEIGTKCKIIFSTLLDCLCSCVIDRCRPDCHTASMSRKRLLKNNQEIADYLQSISPSVSDDEECSSNDGGDYIPNPNELSSESEEENSQNKPADDAENELETSAFEGKTHNEHHILIK